MYQQYPPPQVIYYGSQYGGCFKFFLYLLSFFMPLLGLIFGLVYMSRPDVESKSLGRTCLIISIISFVLICCSSVLAALLGFLPVLTLPFLEGQGF